MPEAPERTPHDESGINLRAIVIGGAVTALGIAIALAAPWMVIAHEGASAGAPGNASRPALRTPAQRTAPVADLARYRREKRRELEEPGVDPASGAPHIPIERAMELLAARGAQAEGARR